MCTKCWGVNVSESVPAVTVALLYETAALSEHVRETLSALGASIVYEAHAPALDRAALDRSSANVVVVNLDAQDADLENVYSLLDEPRYRVIFNDGDVSSTLEGWDHARWVRHLATKIFEGADIDPPRPADAQAVPMRAATPIEPTAPAPEPATVDATIAAKVAEPASAPDVALASATTNDETVVAPAPVAAPALAQPVADTSAVAMAVEIPHELGDASALIDFDNLLDAPVSAPALPSASVPAVPAGAFDAFDLDQFGDLDFAGEAASAESTVPSAPTAVATEEFVAEPATAANEARHVPGFGAFDLALVPADDFDFDDDIAALDAPPPVSPAVAAARAPAVEADEVDELAPLEWSLDIPSASPPLPEAVPHASAFGIEKLSAEEFLAPAAEAAPNVPASLPAFSLELMPLDEAVAPVPFESAPHEHWADAPATGAAKVRIQHVWVLGASIGGPEAVREFLAALPRDFPALFVLAQHLGDEFVEMMARQLGQASALQVRVPLHGERASHGEVLIAPTGQRLLVDRQGVVVLERNSAPTPFNPSIDRVLCDVADRFGSDAGAIIFSGMSTDAAAGCRHLFELGGVVRVQRPDTCVVSTMIDGVMAQGVVTYSGSPQELAQKLVAESG